jgi:N-acetylmuramoyl-L-alanine amidase
MKRSNYTWLLDAGHGGIDNSGKYHCLAGGKSYQHPDFTIYEGVVNRQIAKKLYQHLLHASIDFKIVYDEVEDWSLTKRVKLINGLASKSKNCILLSIHSNAGKGSGNEVFTSPGLTPSDIIAEVFCLQYIREFSEFPFRKGVGEGKHDKGLDKEAKFTMLTDTICPAVLVESFFFDEYRQAQLLRSEAGQNRIVSVLLNSILHIESTKPI